MHCLQKTKIAYENIDTEKAEWYIEHNKKRFTKFVKKIEDSARNSGGKESANSKPKRAYRRTEFEKGEKL